eukprot:Amastigsp_a676889_94.p6 type:complete len:109 gc:universal Amastigsp_a676889_94:910-584(-)
MAAGRSMHCLRGQPSMGRHQGANHRRVLESRHRGRCATRPRQSHPVRLRVRVRPVPHQGDRSKGRRGRGLAGDRWAKAPRRGCKAAGACHQRRRREMATPHPTRSRPW